MKIAVFCATQRGLLFLQELYSILESSEFIVCSFREDPFEPEYFQDIKSFSVDHNMDFFEIKGSGVKTLRKVFEQQISLVFVVHWRFKLPTALFQHVTLGTIVLHDSLLPRYRGFSPTVWAIINGEEKCGASMLYLVDGTDEGDIIDQEAVSILHEDTIAEVMGKMDNAYLTLLRRSIGPLLEGRVQRMTQDESKATYTCKRIPEDNRINWCRSTAQLHNLIRAVSWPYTGAFTHYKGERLYIWSARPSPMDRHYVGRIPGRVLERRSDEGVIIATGDGALLLQAVQLRDGPVVAATEVIRSIRDTLTP